MPSVFIPVSPFPNVPQLPGVPQLVRSGLIEAQSVLDTGLLIGQVIRFAIAQAPVWGIFNQNNVKVINPDSIFSLNARAEWRKSNYPQQLGAFVSYNKVPVPGVPTVRMNKGGSLSDRKTFLKQIRAIAGDTNLYNIITPEETFVNVNVSKVEYTRRSSEGAYFLEVDIMFEAVNQQNAQYSSTAANTANAVNPTALPTVNGGNVQAVPLTSAQSSTSAQAAAAIAQAPF
jgi:hypothetical protein